MAVTVQEVVDYVLRTPLNTNKAILNAMLNELADSGSNEFAKLRRDNDYNYAKVGDSFIPENGEVCLVDTSKDGLRAKCGDGESTWNQLDYIDEFVVKGYHYEGKFYKDASHTKEVPGAIHKIYIDIKDRTLYFFNEDEFYSVSGIGTTSKTTASEDTAGTMKLYQSIGENTDGTMSQKAILDELDDKVEVTLDASEELLVFTR